MCVRFLCEQSISARGALRSDTGVSMPQSMMPY
jgi:hypothetical protein